MDILEHAETTVATSSGNVGDIIIYIPIFMNDDGYVYPITYEKKLYFCKSFIFHCFYKDFFI